MKLRAAKEALITVAFIMAAVLVTYLATVAMGRLNIPALICFGLILVIAALCGTGSVGFLQKRGFRLLAYAAILAFLTLLHLVLACDSVAVTKLVDRLTGYYELEATAFYLLYANLFFIGFSVGSALGALMRRYGKRPGYDKA